MERLFQLLRGAIELDRDRRLRSGFRRNCRRSYKAIVELDGTPPNGDGTNDILLIRGSSIETVNLTIYNRWGQKVFESNSLTQGWDGTFNGKMQGIDIYAYVLRATFIDGSSTIKKGNINLLR